MIRNNLPPCKSILLSHLPAFYVHSGIICSATFLSTKDHSSSDPPFCPSWRPEWHFLSSKLSNFPQTPQPFNNLHDFTLMLVSSHWQYLLLEENVSHLIQKPERDKVASRCNQWWGKRCISIRCAHTQVAHIHRIFIYTSIHIYMHVYTCPTKGITGRHSEQSQKNTNSTKGLILLTLWMSRIDVHKWDHICKYRYYYIHLIYICKVDLSRSQSQTG